MIGSLNLESREVVIIGAGISGLLAAYELDRSGFEVTLIDQATRAGGLIQTDRSALGLSESAAHSVLVTDELRELFDDLGVPLCPVREGSRSRFIFRGGKARRFPLTVWEAIRAVFRAYFVLSRDNVSNGSASMENWAKRHLGQSALDYLISPFLTGIYAADPSEISVAAAFPALQIEPGHSLLSAQLRKWSQRRRTEKRRSEMMAPEGGMQSLVTALERRLKARLGGRFRLGEKVSALPQCRNTILAVPAGSAAELLKHVDPELSEKLKRVRYAPLASATIFIPRDSFKKPPRGIGVLIPRVEKREALGVLFNSSAFQGRVNDDEKWVSLTMMLGGTGRPEAVERTNDEIETAIKEELLALFEVSPEGLASAKTEIRKWPRAIPIYDPALLEVWRTARLGWCRLPGHVLFGNYAGQVSIRGMAQSARALSSKMAAGLHAQTK